MSFANPANLISRQSIVGVENEYVKMFDPRPVGASPPTPELMDPTSPVPEVMAALGVANAPAIPHTLRVDLLQGLSLRTWDNRKNITFFTIKHSDLKAPFNGGLYPSATIRVPRGAIYHGKTQGKGPPPHTIHWHGIEPTPMNDGVGHCSQEIGTYTYQWQPNFIGTYFYHCHRNTMQHFEFGLFGLLVIVPPDAYFSSIASTNPATGAVTLNNIKVGASSDGKFRNACNIPELPGFVGGDPVFGVGGPGDQGTSGDHAFTAPYDVEAIWVLDDRDSIWSDLASNAFTTFPEHGTQPGVNDNFHDRPGTRNFFNFNDYRADYWWVTGVPVPAARQGSAAIQNPAAVFGTPDGTIPAALNSGQAGTQVAINARVGQTILVRCLDAAYAFAEVTFPVDVVIGAWDGRALGVPPFGKYNAPIPVPAGTPIRLSTARRFDAWIRPAARITSTVKVDFFETRGGGREMTALIPFNIR